jgi:hypothetical protein
VRLRAGVPGGSGPAPLRGVGEPLGVFGLVEDR